MEELPQEDYLRYNFMLSIATDLQSQLEKQKTSVESLYPWTQSSKVEQLTGFIYKSEGLSPELQNLASLTKVNYLPVIVNYLTNALQVSGITKEGRSYTEAWKAWNSQEMSQKEKWLYKNTLNYAEGIAIIKRGWDGHGRVVIASPQKVGAFRFDFNDRFVSYGIEVVNLEKRRYNIYDDKYIYGIRFSKSPKNEPEVEFIEEHGFTRCPIVSVLNEWDLVKEKATGEIEPYINAQKLIFKALWDTEATSHSQGFKVRYITGLELPEEEVDDEGNPITDRASKYLAEIRQDSLLVSPNPETRIGTLPETPIDGLLKNVEAAVQHLAAISTTPFYILQQTLSNISTDTAITATQNTRNKIADRQQRFGAGIRNIISLLMELEGDFVEPEDIQIIWKATDQTQLAAYADAWGKIKTSLDIPAKAFWNKLTDIGFTPEDIELAYELYAEKEEQERRFSNAVLGSVSDSESAGLPEPDDTVNEA